MTGVRQACTTTQRDEARECDALVIGSGFADPCGFEVADRMADALA